MSRHVSLYCFSDNRIIIFNTNQIITCWKMCFIFFTKLEIEQSVKTCVFKLNVHNEKYIKDILKNKKGVLICIGGSSSSSFFFLVFFIPVPWGRGLTLLIVPHLSLLETKSPDVTQHCCSSDATDQKQMQLQQKNDWSKANWMST